MNYTNKHSLPEEVVRAIMKDRYTDPDEAPSDFSATTLVAPIQQTILKRRYPDQHIIRDVVDYFWSFIGSIAHAVLEEAWHESIGSIVEKRLYIEVAGKSVSGKMDCYHDGEIRDYKSTKSYKIMKGDYSDWEKQLNVYAYLCRKNGLEVNRLRVIGFILDWKKGEAYKKGYPDTPVVEIPLRLWTEEEQEAYIENRVLGLILAETANDDLLSIKFPCSKKEMWSDIRDYAIIKNGADRATKVFDNHEEAMRVFNSGKYSHKDYSLTTRYTKRTRCLEHCPVSHLCKQNQRLLEEEGIEPQQQQSPAIF